MKAHLRLAACAAIVTWCSVTPGVAMAGPGGCRTTGFHATSFHLLEAGKSFNGAPVKFYNYDFGTPTCARANNVEWPIDLLFYNNAEIRTIESGLSGFFPYGKPFASTEYARINDGAGAFWARNGGRKRAAESVGTSDDHYRVYAYSQRSYTTGLGYFVIGSMHKDFNEAPGFSATYGSSEKAESDLAVDARIIEGWEVFPNNYNMRNEQYGKEGNHTWENNGLATMIHMK
jgi:hypothetical protein